jgi:hypothetical protein
MSLYPLLSSEPKKLDAYFQDKICFLYFNVSRKDSESTKDISSLFRHLLCLLKHELHIHRKNGLLDKDFYYLEYLEVLFKMVANTRDITGGKGEHDISYMMLYELYQVFPSISVYLLHRFVKPLPYVYGCWRDIKYLCQYIREHSMKEEEDSFISVCIELMNQQLKKDVETWTYSVNAKSRDHVSNVAKWIPREKKQFGWLFDKLAVHWSNTYGRWKLNWYGIDHDSHHQAFIKCKMQYRKIITKMNKHLDTTEIKFCSKKWDEIQPHTVSKYTVMKHHDLFLSLSDTNRSSCSEKYVESKLFYSPLNKKYGSVDSIVNLPISYFVKEALRLNSISQPTNVSHEIYLLNSQWDKFLKHYPYLHKSLPIVDVSYKMQEDDSESFYYAIGLSILVSQKSSFKDRILIIDNSPTWINLDSSKQFIDKVQNIFSTIRSREKTASNFKYGIDFILQPLENNFFKNISFLFFSNTFGEPDLYNYIETEFLEHKIKHSKFYFWNLSKKGLMELPCDSICSGVYFLSGFSPSVLYSLSCNYSSYHFIYKILNNDRYGWIGSYFKELVQ